MRALLARLRLEHLRHAYHRRRGGLDSALSHLRGRRKPHCIVCGSERVEILEAGVGMAFRVPRTLRRWVGELRRRDNGRCLGCGLEQAFYRFTEDGRRAIYAEPFELLGTDEEMRRYPYDDVWVAARSAEQFARRLEVWDEFFRARGVTTLGRVLHLRFHLGGVLAHFRDRYGADVYGLETVDNFRRYARDHRPFIRQLPGDLSGRIEVDAGGTKFDLIICLHTLTHSVDPLGDLEALRNLLADGGYVIFSDEISGKAHNTFHQVHFSERTFTAIVSRYFDAVARLDRTGATSEFTAGRTEKGDNPDFVAFGPRRLPAAEGRPEGREAGTLSARPRRQPAIALDGLGKRYRIGPAPRYQALRDVLYEMVTVPWRRHDDAAAAGNGHVRTVDTIWALQDVSFEVRYGESVGIIGRNGAGKSTLLKVLSRITEPTEGTATIHGRVGSLLEVGTGFHPELTARENIHLSAAILGMSRAEVARRFDEIVNFAEVEEFLETPVKHFSSGMYMRLAFAVASHLEPEILIVDEVLAVGDAAFQRKCLGRMSEVSKEGRTVLFVSHNMASIQALTDRCLWLDRGRVVEDGPSRDVVAHYTFRMAERTEHQGTVDLSKPECRRGAHKPTMGELQFVALELTNSAGRASGVFFEREPIDMRLVFRAHTRRAWFQIRCWVKTLEGVLLGTCTSGQLDTDLAPGLYGIRCSIDPNVLRPGTYVLGLYLKSGLPQDIVPEAATIEIVPNQSIEDDADYYGDVGLIRMTDSWGPPTPLPATPDLGAAAGTERR